TQPGSPSPVEPRVLEAYGVGVTHEVPVVYEVAIGGRRWVDQRRGCNSHVASTTWLLQPRRCARFARTSLALWCGFSSTRGPAVTYASRDQVFRLAPGAVSGSWRGLRRRRRPLVAAGA